MDTFSFLKIFSQKKGKEVYKIDQGKDVVSARVYIPSDSMGALENEFKCKVAPNLRQEAGLCTPVLVGCRLPLWESDIIGE